MKRFSFIIALAILVTCGVSAQAVSFVDALGRTINLPGKALRVVSLSPALTEILFASGAGSHVVGRTSYCNYPAHVSTIAQVGAYSPESISVETIIALKPDLIIGEVSPHDQLSAMFAAAGLRCALLDLKDFNAVYAAVELAGRVSGDPGMSSRLVADMKARVEAIRAKSAGITEAKKPAVFWETWDEPLMTCGPKTFTGMILSGAGARNIFADVSEDWPVVSFEAIVARDPDIIMSADSHGLALTAEKLAARPLWGGIKAVRNHRIVLLDGDIVSRPGPRFVEALELIAKALYPEVFK